MATVQHRGVGSLVGSLIDDDEPEAYELVNGGGASRVVITCDHASAQIPRRLGTLGLRREDLTRHVAWDVGAADVARRLAERLDAPLVLAGYSRLVVDCNRPLHVPEAFVTRSEDVAVPGNAELDEAQRRARADVFYWPYHDAINDLVTARAASAVPVLVSLHSYAPVYHGRRRPWDVGVLSRTDKRLATLALDWLRAEGDLHVGDNEPYRIALDEDFTVPVHAERRGIPATLLEIRHDHIERTGGAEAWAERLARMLDTVLGHPAVGVLGEPATDAYEPRYT